MDPIKSSVLVELIFSESPPAPEFVKIMGLADGTYDVVGRGAWSSTFIHVDLNQAVTALSTLPRSTVLPELTARLQQLARLVAAIEALPS
ncbi:MAG: hypothetical protein ACREM8_00790 [Vulcanimicrobiaceae bacterium]